jgi:lipopolysaccharide export system ATP-binding protein
VYDIDQAVMVMTGKGLKLTTPQQVMTARDSLEYWANKRMAVGRGNAVVVTADGRRLAADVLVAYLAAPEAGAPKPASDNPQQAAGKLDRVEAFGNVELRTATDTARGDRGIYVEATGIARLIGHVRITHGQNQINGPAADVNMRTGVAHLVSNPEGGRVQGLIVPDDAKKRGGAGLVASGVGKTYRKRPVVRNVSLSVRRGEAVGLLGPNGAGKTTTFYMIVGLVRPDTGSISLDGEDITTFPMYRRARLGIGYLPQEASVFRGLNVEQNVMAALEVTEPDGDRREHMLAELLAEFGIGHLRRTPALALSGGERRRVEIARALATRPSYILLDEPLAGIDPIAVGEIRDLVSHLKHRGLGVLITDHNVRETLGIIDRAYIMHDGQVMMEGEPGAVVADENVRRVYLGDRFTL